MQRSLTITLNDMTEAEYCHQLTTLLKVTESKFSVTGEVKPKSGMTYLVNGQPVDYDQFIGKQTTSSDEFELQAYQRREAKTHRILQDLLKLLPHSEVELGYSVVALAGLVHERVKALPPRCESCKPLDLYPTLIGDPTEESHGTHLNNIQTIKREVRK